MRSRGGSDSLLLRDSLLNFGFQLRGRSAHKEQVRDSFLHQNGADMPLTLKVNSIVQLLDMHGVKDRFYEGQSLGCLDLQRLILSCLQVLVLRSIPASNSYDIGLGVVVELLHPDHAIEALLHVRDETSVTLFLNLPGRL